MPGFIVNGTGGDIDTPGASATAEFRRKHRWRVKTGGGMADGDWTYLQKAQRPHFKYDEPVAHHNEEEAWFAGKRHWEPITFTFYDKVGDNVGASGGGSPGAAGGDICGDIVAWLGGGGGNNVGDWPNANTFLPVDYKQTIILQSLGGTGVPDETWSLFNAWAKEANFNELDYTNTELQTVTVIVRYDRAARAAGDDS